MKGFTTTDGIDLNEILYGTVLPIIDLYNAEEELDLRAMMCIDGDEGYYKFDASGHWKFSALAEAEKPTSRKIKWGKRQKDTVKYGLEIDYTFDWLMSEQSSAKEIAMRANKAINRDRALQTAKILDVCVQSATDGFYNASFSSDENMTTPPTYGAKSFATTHTHYVGAGATTLALSHVTAAKEHIKEHGYKGQIWGFCNADFFKKIEDLAGWAALTSSAFIIPNKVVDGISVDGFKGRLLGIDWKETEWMADDYFLLIGTMEGQDKPVRYVQKKNESAKGLILTPGSYDIRYPIIDATYLHWLEAQVIYRGAGTTYKLAATWGNPTATTTNVVY
jgi:hypothetical protein